MIVDTFGSRQPSSTPEAPALITSTISAYESPVRNPQKATLVDSSERRVRFAPSRFAEDQAAAIKRPPTREEKAQAEANRTTREQLMVNEENIRSTAEKYACPLLRAAKEAEGIMPSNSLEYLLATQMKQVAVASDGQEYDFAALRAHILKGMREAQGPLSPITKRPLKPEVRYTARKRDPKTGAVVEGVLVTKVWKPERDYDARHIRTS